MTKHLMDIEALPKFIVNSFGTSKVMVHKHEGIVTIEPIAKEKKDYCARVKGMFANFPEMSVDNFLKRKHADKELDL